MVVRAADIYVSSDVVALYAEKRYKKKKKTERLYICNIAQFTKPYIEILRVVLDIDLRIPVKTQYTFFCTVKYIYISTTSYELRNITRLPVKL